MKQKKYTPLAALAGLALAAGSASAAITLDFTNSSGTFADGTITFGSLDVAEPTVVSDTSGLATRTTPTGSLSGVDGTHTFSFLYSGYVSSSVEGSDITVGATDFMASNASGIASRNGDINATGRAMGFTFDLSSFALNTGLRITDFTATGTGEAQIVVDGSSVTNLGGLTGSGLSIDIVDGDFLVFRNISETSSQSYRVTTLTMETFIIPEPTTALLGGLGLLALLRRRR